MCLILAMLFSFEMKYLFIQSNTKISVDERTISFTLDGDYSEGLFWKNLLEPDIL